ncbi:MAG: feruloyl-CoA synthase [Rhodospirillales bacterium]|nr:feruloyl-CoA synthase [Rhodospirillales bacterium]
MAAQAPLRPVDFAPRRVDVERRADGGVVLRGPALEAGHPASLGAVLERRALEIADRVFLAERAADGDWRRITFGEARDAVRALGQALLDRGCGPRRPLAILSGNSIDHALLTFAAMHVGAPAAPVSVAYSMMSQDHAKLAHVVRSLTPAVIFADDGAAYANAVASLRAQGLLDGVRLVFTANAPAGAETLADLLAVEPTADVDRALAAVRDDTVAKVLFTSGSTGMPKGVINTQRMLCTNQQAALQTFPFLAQRPPVLLDWLPWNHTFGGNFVLHLALWNGGTLHIDDGRPMPGLIEKTVRNLREVAPTLYLNVPRGYDLLLPYLEGDPAIARALMADSAFLFYGGAALPEPVWDRLVAVSERTLGRRIPLTAAWGSTETAPLATALHWPVDRPGNIGLPVPGVEVQLTPNGTKMELRVRGPNVTPGYWRDPEKTAAAFDAEGFYRIGDAGRLADPGDPMMGVIFDGRVVEDFKLTSGTFVHVGGLRLAVVGAGSPVVQDCVVTGHDRDEIGALVFLNPAACAALVPGATATTPLAAFAAHPAVRDLIARGLAAHNRANPGGSTRVRRALLLESPPGIDANEITDKGYVNQRAVLDNRAADVARLHAATPDPGVIVVPA